MEFKDRKTTNPGRIILENVQTKARTTYDVILADNPTEQGTPLTKQVMENLKEEILDQAKNSIPSVDVKNLKTVHIKGKLVVNPTYDTEKNLYNEGIRVNKASNGWSNIEVGGDNDSTADTCQDLWIIARRGENGATSGSIGDLTIECNSAAGNGLTLYKDGSAPTWKGKKIITEDAFVLSGTTLTIKL